MGAMLSLNGAMIPRSARREFDERAEARVEAGAASAMLGFRGRHAVRLVNTSPSGAMAIFGDVPHIGERVSLQLLDREPLGGRVRWVRDGRVSINSDGVAE